MRFLFFVLLSFQIIAQDISWTNNTPLVRSYSSPRTADLNNDGMLNILDVILIVNQIITQDTKKITIPVEHLRLFKTGLKMFYDKPIIGHGPKTYRVACNEDKYKMKLHDNLTNCNTHPHNTYIQMLAETGIVGTLPIILMLIYTISKIVKNYIIIFNKNYDNYNLLELFVFIALLLTLWPLISTGSFFNNWIKTTTYIKVVVMMFNRINAGRHSRLNTINETY